MKPQFLTIEEVIKTTSIEDFKNGIIFEKNEFPKICTIEFDQYEETFFISVMYGPKFEETIEGLETLEEAVKEINSYLTA